MAIQLTNAQLMSIFERLKAGKEDRNKIITEFVALLQPIIKLTKERFNQNLGDDIEGECLLNIVRKIDYLTNSCLSGGIKNPTHYFFTFFYNAAMGTLKKELRYSSKIVSIEDVKVDRAITPKNYHKQKILDHIHQELEDWAKARFPHKHDAERACRYINLILDGKRPKFSTRDIHAWYNGRQVPAKEAYSIILQRVRNRLAVYYDDLIDAGRTWTVSMQAEKRC
jgi:hypothetical protein